MIPTNHDSSAKQRAAKNIVHRTSRPTSNRRRRFAYRLGISLLALALVSGAAAGLLAYQVATVRTQLEKALGLVPQLRSQVENGNILDAQRTFAEIDRATSPARETVTGPAWKAASAIPFLGANFGAVTEVAVSADDVMTMAVAPLLETYSSLNWGDLSPKEGRVELAPLIEAAPNITAAANALRLSHERLSSIDVSRLLPQVADPVVAATGQLEGVSSTLGSASSAVQLLPVMLGAEGPRNYLVLIQNSAESRATGGIPGALATLAVEDGQITLADQSSAVALGTFVPSLSVDREQESLYTSRLGTHMQNVNLTPDFPTAAETAKRMWEERHPAQVVDGVLALDPIVLGHLLAATGKVDVDDPEVLSLIEGTSLPSQLTQNNVVPTLLSDIYREVQDPAAQDAYFAAVASRVFSAFTEGKGNSSQLFQALRSSADERRIYLWSSRQNEQEIIADTSLAGSVHGVDSGGATFGLYFNDGTGAKMDYYLTRKVQLQQSCRPEGYSSYTVTVDVTNHAPLDAASVLPAYVTGGGKYGVELGHIRTNYVFYGPAQAFVESASLNGNQISMGSGKHGQRPVGTVSVELGPGETGTLELTFSHVVQDSQPQLQVTPSIQPSSEVITPFESAACG